MLCEKCGKNVATTHVKRTINGKTEEHYYCAECAKAQGVQSLWDSFDLGLGNFWGSLFADPGVRPLTDTVRCEGCGHSFREIVESGHAGCPQCYTTFYDRLLPSIQRIHGKVQHTGKIPVAGGEKARRQHKLDTLKRELEENIEKQNYEACAKLRDEIKEWEAKEHD